MLAGNMGSAVKRVGRLPASHMERKGTSYLILKTGDTAADCELVFSSA